MKKSTYLAGLAAFGIAIQASSARAVVLEQKWTAGQKLSYQTALDGTMNVQVPPGVNFPLAGIPLEVEVSGSGVAHLKIVSVDPNGVGTLVMSVPDFDLKAQVLGQKSRVTLKEKSIAVSINGQPVKLGDGKTPLVNPLGDPQVALRVSRQGRFLGVQPLQPKTAPATKNEADNPGKPVAPGAAINRSALLMASLIRALPTLWPGRDVQIGEKWKSEISLPIPSRTDPKTLVPTQFGAYNWTLKGLEILGGKALQRVGVTGEFNVDSTQFQPGDAKTDAKNPRGVAQQTVSGDVWLDARAGQIERAELVLGARVEGGQTAKAQGFADFTGTLQINLKNAA